MFTFNMNIMMTIILFRRMVTTSVIVISRVPFLNLVVVYGLYVIVVPLGKMLKQK